MAVIHEPPTPRTDHGAPRAADALADAAGARAGAAVAPATAANAPLTDLFEGGGELGARMRAIDWSATPLGPVERWPQSLKTCLRIVLTSRQPMFVWWGDSLINLYNDAYKSIVGGKHPEALGQPAYVVWREIWDQVEPRAARAMRENAGTYDEALLLIMERYGYPEETYYTFSYSPVPNDQGGTGGILCANTDDTARIIGERQILLLRELAARTADARSLGDTLRLAGEALATNPRDLPFAAIYLSAGAAGGAGAAAAAGGAGAATLELAGTAGIARGHALVPETIALDAGGGSRDAAGDASGGALRDTLAAFAAPGAFATYEDALRNVIARHEPVVIDLPAGSAPPAGAWPQPPSRMVLLPIAQAGHRGRAGVLAVGLSPYRQLDEAYRGFLGLVAGQLAGSIANARAYEDERRRAEESDAAGAVTGVVGGAIEITEQIKARRAIEASEARFRRIFESSMIGFLFSRVDGTVLDANDYFLRLLDVTREDVRAGRVRWTDRTAPGYEARTEEALRQLRETGTSTPFEKEYIDAAGRRVPVVVGSTLLPGTGDENVTFVLDISERKRVEQQLALLAEASRVIASASDAAQALQTVARLCSPILGDWCGIYLLDDTGAFSVAGSHHVDAAQHARARAVMTGFRPAPDADYGVGYVARTGEPQLLPDVTAAMRRRAAGAPGTAALAERFAVRSSILVPLAAQQRTFGVISFGISESARRFDDKDLLLAEELGRRISQALETARLHAERDALLASERHARGEAESASRAKDEFLALLGHELRNPLAPILTALQLMQLRGAQAVERERAVIERQTHHLVRLVDDLLDVSRITRGKIELKRERVELAPVVARAIEMASPLIEQRRHDLEIDVPPRGLALDADPARLAQVIANLLTNAAKYTERGGRITITAARAGADGSELALAVRDTGIGIAPDVLPRVFDMFVQERQALDRSQGGLGLGLAIVRSLVALHGGTVSVHSAGQGQGSEFTIRLPAAAAPPGADAAGARAVATAVRPEPGALRILVVDDNEDAADLLSSLLESMGHATQVAHDGPDALRAAGPFAPELALLDIGLPVMDGYELAQRLRQQLAGRLRLVAVTGYGLDSDRERARAAGFDAHLVKPVSIDRLGRIIAELCPDAARRAP